MVVFDEFPSLSLLDRSGRIDPVRDRYFVLLTNRAFGTGTLHEMRTARRAFHDALGDL